MQRIPLVPPGGFIGAQSQTSAGQTALLGARGSSPRRRRRTSSRRARMRKSSRRASSRRRRSRKSPMRLVKGSAAAKRYMAKLRRMRKRK